MKNSAEIWKWGEDLGGRIRSSFWPSKTVGERKSEMKPWSEQDQHGERGFRVIGEEMIDEWV